MEANNVKANKEVEADEAEVAKAEADEEVYRFCCCSRIIIPLK